VRDFSFITGFSLVRVRTISVPDKKCWFAGRQEKSIYDRFIITPNHPALAENISPRFLDESLVVTGIPAITTITGTSWSING
jgi:hypothetical protein